VDSNSESPTVNDVADFVRAWSRIAVKRQIDPETQFERDLGITGDDGSELLEAAQKKFDVDLFNAEGFGPAGRSNDSVHYAFRSSVYRG
jgi:hypothetical protein